MSDDLLHYYERELTFVREMGAEFGRKFPKIAGRLQLEADKCEDPHTERLIEAFALLGGRIHKKIEDHFPEITEALFQVLYPHYVAPIPSMSVVCFDASRQAVAPTGYRIEKNTVLYSKPVGGIACQFATGYPVTIFPMEVAHAALTEPKKLVRNAQQALLVQLRTTNNLSFSQIACQSLRFFLNGTAQHVYHLYELLLNNVCHVECSWTNAQGAREAITLGVDAIRPVGFEPDEALIPFDGRTYSGYPLLFEYFCFPEKFLFFDLSGLEKLSASGVGAVLDISFYLDRPAKANLLVTRETFCLHAAPVVNLFKRTAEPIHIDQQRTEYQVVPDLRRAGATEIFTVDKVVASTIGSDRETVYRPFYSLDHHADDSGSPAARAYWHVRRQPSGKEGDDGTDLYLSFADLDFQPADPGADVVHVQLTCTNRDLPARLTMGDAAGDFETELAAPVAAIRCLVKPTLPRRPSLGGALQWRLISHLSLNHLSLVKGNGEALKEILKLYDFDDSPATRQQISGLVSLGSEYITKRVGPSFCRGVQVTMTFDEDKYVGHGLYLFASILERFLGQYVSINSFTRLVAQTLQRKESLKQWPPRNGQRVLL
jgi:type VI secretion system protein ImpG